jgi:hypothetical protein
MEADEDAANLDDLRETLRDELTRAASEVMDRLRAEAQAGDAEGAAAEGRLDRGQAQRAQVAASSRFSVTWPSPPCGSSETQQAPQVWQS